MSLEALEEAASRDNSEALRRHREKVAVDDLLAAMRVETEARNDDYRVWCEAVEDQRKAWYRLKTIVEEGMA